MPFVTTYHSAEQDVKKTLMVNWSLMENQPLLKTMEDPRSYPTKEVNPWKACLLEQKCNSRAFDNATQPQKPHRKSVQVCLWLPFNTSPCVQSCLQTLNIITISLYTSLLYTNCFCCPRRLCHHYSIQGTKHYHSQLIIARIMFQSHPQPGLTLQSTYLHKPQKVHTCTNISLTRWVSWWCCCCFSFYKRTDVC